LKEYEKEIGLKLFKQRKEALKYLKSLENRWKKACVGNQHVFGRDKGIKDFSRKSEYLKIFHKNLLQEIPFIRV
jgi:hypothetical protein